MRERIHDILLGPVDAHPVADLDEVVCDRVGFGDVASAVSVQVGACQKSVRVCVFIFSPLSVHRAARSPLPLTRFGE